MSTSNTGIIELSLVFGGLLAFLLWELFSLRKRSRPDNVDTKE